MIAQEEDRKVIWNAVAREAGKGRFEGKQVLIFGCTPYARDIREALQEQGIPLAAMLDNNPQKAGGTCLGVPVYLPERYFEEHSGDVLVILCSRYNREMAAQLEELGLCSENRMDIPVKESRRGEEDSLENLQAKFRQVEEGYQFYLDLIADDPADFWIFLCPYPGTGDIYMACMYLDAYLEREGIRDYAVVVTAESCRKTARLFGIDDVRKVSQDELDGMLKAWEFFGTRKMRIKPLLYWGWRTKRCLYADEHPQITFNEMFLYDVFDLTPEVRRKRITVDRESRYAQELFEELELKPHRTVIMAPYAGSFVSEMGMEVWEELAAVFQKHGWSVASNCNGDKEKPVPGTTPIWFPYQEAVQVLEYAGAFLALRSGLCDIVSQAQCKKVIIYESGFNAARYEYFSLNKMGLCTDAVEFVYGKDEKEVMKREIVRSVLFSEGRN